MVISKYSTFLLLLLLLLSVMQGFMSRDLVKHMAHVDFENGSERKLYTLFTPSYSNIFSSLNTRKRKVNQIHIVSHRKVPGGPDPLHD